MEENKEMYELICKERFDTIDEKQDEILGILRGTNNNPGLCEQVRTNTKFNKTVLGFCVAIGLIFLTQFVVWLRIAFF
jgi:hypothetical protein